MTKKILLSITFLLISLSTLFSGKINASANYYCAVWVGRSGGRPSVRTCVRCPTATAFPTYDACMAAF